MHWTWNGGALGYIGTQSWDAGWGCMEVQDWDRNASWCIEAQDGDALG